MDRKVSATSSHGIRGYISVIAILEFIVLIKRLKFSYKLIAERLLLRYVYVVYPLEYLIKKPLLSAKLIS